MHKILFLCLVLVLYNTSGKVLTQKLRRPFLSSFLSSMEDDYGGGGGITRTEFENLKEELKQWQKELLDKIDEKIQAAMMNVGGLLGGLVSNRNSDIYRDYDY